jgi:hypothetical protein
MRYISLDDRDRREMIQVLNGHDPVTDAATPATSERPSGVETQDGSSWRRWAVGVAPGLQIPRKGVRQMRLDAESPFFV